VRSKESTASDRLRIGELARLAATTTRAIRHYHAIGVLSEPERDASGYRRYGADQLVRLIRIRRLRDLDMPLDQIAAHLSRDVREHGDLPTALPSLADDISRQIDDLEALRGKILGLAAAGGLPAPAETWSAALRRHGLLGDEDALPAGEAEAVELVDVLHPEGVEGVIAQASGLLSDPAVIERLTPLLQRFRALPADAGDEVVEALAADYAAVFPRPESAPPAIELETMDKLIGHRLSPAQRRCMQRVRHLLEAGER
jgi:DNA-binding transcriptional MerR regulator